MSDQNVGFYKRICVAKPNTWFKEGTICYRISEMTDERALFFGVKVISENDQDYLRAGFKVGEEFIDNEECGYDEFDVHLIHLIDPNIEYKIGDVWVNQEEDKYEYEYEDEDSDSDYIDDDPGPIGSSFGSLDEEAKYFDEPTGDQYRKYQETDPVVIKNPNESEDDYIVRKFMRGVMRDLVIRNAQLKDQVDVLKGDIRHLEKYVQGLNDKIAMFEQDKEDKKNQWVKVDEKNYESTTPTALESVVIWNGTEYFVSKVFIFMDLKKYYVNLNVTSRRDVFVPFKHGDCWMLIPTIK